MEEDQGKKELTEDDEVHPLSQLAFAMADKSTATYQLIKELGEPRDTWEGPILPPHTWVYLKGYDGPCEPLGIIFVDSASYTVHDTIQIRLVDMREEENTIILNARVQLHKVPTGAVQHTIFVTDLRVWNVLRNKYKGLTASNVI